MPVLYSDEDGTPISTHSMIKTFRRCPKQAEYKYVRRLKPKLVSLPLKRGSWFHSMLEAFYGASKDGYSRDDAADAAWEVHDHLSYKFSELFEEEREDYGDLPGDVRRLFKSYLWHYEHDEWKIHDVEFTLDTTFPDGSIYRCKIDTLVEDQFGLWLADHKTHKSLPNHDYRVIDSQSGLYLWSALRNKIPVQGFIFNYIRTKAPTLPTPIKNGSRISRWDTIDTDYPTAVEGLKKYGFMTKKKVIPYRAKLLRLKKQQYQPGAPQGSSFFRRDVIEKSTDMIKKVALEAYHTHQRMNDYFPAPHPDAVERVPDRSCSYFCSYPDICSIELFGGNTQSVLKRFKEGDPLEYYGDNETKEEDLEHGG